MEDDAAGAPSDPLHDPCREGGFDQLCRDAQGRLCEFHLDHCAAPEYRCIDLLRHALALSFLEQIAERRKLEAVLASDAAANDLGQVHER